MGLFNRLRQWTAPQQVTLSFVAVILVGSLLLAIPAFHQPTAQVSYLDHLFTAVSMVCVTGLTVLSVQDTYNVWGQIVGVILMQIGGLGLITIITASLFYFHRRLSLKSQYIFREAMNRNTHRDFKRFLSSVYAVTFVIEGVAAVILATQLIPLYGIKQGIGSSIFLAVSAFCNAGFDNLGSTSIQRFLTNDVINYTIALLIFAGGLGFSVWFELGNLIKKWFEDRPHTFKLIFNRISPHSRIVLRTTFILLALGTSITLMSEFNNPETIGSLNLWEKFTASFFQSVAFRTAGFSTLDYTKTTPFTNFIYMVQMIIGGAPGGTAGGMKVTTVALIALLFRSELLGYSQVAFHNRSFPIHLVRQALTILVYFLAVSIVGYSFLLFTQTHLDPFALLFETISAIGTVGSTMNVTGELTQSGRWIIMALMFLGRVGPLTVLISIARKKTKKIYSAPTEILLG
ncbi:TrkH family potassium uptake protein [Dolosicoccus paucivorans]|uniref:TrkH family potassium uptake protein n=1 Tax=Dolosicoccus paucivorans TaxID=84521 RepID=UPI00088A3510|nr:potassium transporter TrkG [Dolosicoccus paucivorans]SDI71990.1 potassium uptake protein, TrkH family [Dolosicoccus paucivorans]